MDNNNNLVQPSKIVDTTKIKKNKKNKKQKCKIEGCKGRVTCVGHCKWCNLDYCQEHRIPEAHSCSGLQDCKTESFKKNEELNNINCQFKKVDIIESY